MAEKIDPIEFAKQFAEKGDPELDAWNEQFEAGAEAGGADISQPETNPDALPADAEQTEPNIDYQAEAAKKINEDEALKRYVNRLTLPEKIKDLEAEIAALAGEHKKLHDAYFNRKSQNEGILKRFRSIFSSKKTQAGEGAMDNINLGQSEAEEVELKLKLDEVSEKYKEKKKELEDLNGKLTEAKEPQLVEKAKRKIDQTFDERIEAIKNLKDKNADISAFKLTFADLDTEGISNTEEIKKYAASKNEIIEREFQERKSELSIEAVEDPDKFCELILEICPIKNPQTGEVINAEQLIADFKMAEKMNPADLEKTISGGNFLEYAGVYGIKEKAINLLKNKEKYAAKMAIKEKERITQALLEEARKYAEEFHRAKDEYKKAQKKEDSPLSDLKHMVSKVDTKNKHFEKLFELSSLVQQKERIYDKKFSEYEKSKRELESMKKSQETGLEETISRIETIIQEVERKHSEIVFELGLIYENEEAETSAEAAIESEVKDKKKSRREKKEENEKKKKEENDKERKAKAKKAAILNEPLLLSQKQALEKTAELFKNFKAAISEKNYESALGLLQNAIADGRNWDEIKDLSFYNAVDRLQWRNNMKFEIIFWYLRDLFGEENGRPELPKKIGEEGESLQKWTARMIGMIAAKEIKKQPAGSVDKKKEKEKKEKDDKEKEEKEKKEKEEGRKIQTQMLEELKNINRNLGQGNRVNRSRNRGGGSQRGR